MWLFPYVSLYIGVHLQSSTLTYVTVLLLGPNAPFLHSSGTLFTPSRMLISLTGKEQSISL